MRTMTKDEFTVGLARVSSEMGMTEADMDQATDIAIEAAERSGFLKKRHANRLRRGRGKLGLLVVAHRRGALKQVHALSAFRTEVVETVEALGIGALRDRVATTAQNVVNFLYENRETIFMIIKILLMVII